MNSYKPKIRQLRRKGLIARNINLPRQIRQRKTNILLYCLYVESKNGRDEPVWKAEIETQT